MLLSFSRGRALFPSRIFRHSIAIVLLALPGSAPLAAEMSIHNTSTPAVFDVARTYSLAELIDFAQRQNPQTRLAWLATLRRRAMTQQARSAFLPQVQGSAQSSDERIINPFPRPLAPLGYTMVDIPEIDAGLSAEYTLLDFGRRRAALASATAQQQAMQWNYQRSLQDVAHAVAVSYYRALSAERGLEAHRQMLQNAQAVQAAAEAALQAGRATLPDVLSARAVTAQHEYDLTTAEQELSLAKVELRETIGIEPSDEIRFTPAPELPSEEKVTQSISSLIDLSLSQRPDLKALSEQLHAAQDEYKRARANHAPEITFASRGAMQGMWPSFSQPSLGDTVQFVWNAGLKVQWSFFDGGQRHAEDAARQADQEQTGEQLRQGKNRTIREVWDAYLKLRTAFQQRKSAETLLDASQKSYDAAFEAYRYGVKNLVDLLTAQSQLAQAQLVAVQADTSVRVSMVEMAYATGASLDKRSR